MARNSYSFRIIIISVIRVGVDQSGIVPFENKFNKFSLSANLKKRRKRGKSRAPLWISCSGNSSRGLKNLPLATIKRMISKRAA